MPDAYDLLEHGLMIGEGRRMDAHLMAISQVVRPGHVVVDVGSGLGLFALAACEAGARRVFAIEPSPIEGLAREIVAANGCASRIEWIRALSSDVSLPEPADVIVMDVRGVLPDEQIGVAIDARSRFLKPGGVIIPAADVIWAAPVEAPELHDRHATAAGDPSGVDLGAARAWLLQQSSRCRARPDQLIGDPARCATISYSTVEHTDIRARLEWTATRAAVVHGVVVWFESRLCDGIELSNRPGVFDALYGQRFFTSPLPRAVADGEGMGAELRGAAVGERYDWRCILDA